MNLPKGIEFDNVKWQEFEEGKFGFAVEIINSNDCFWTAFLFVNNKYYQYFFDSNMFYEVEKQLAFSFFLLKDKEYYNLFKIENNYEFYIDGFYYKYMNKNFYQIINNNEVCQFKKINDEKIIIFYFK